MQNLVQIVSEQLETENASLSFVGKEKVWYKAHSQLEPFCLPVKEAICPDVVTKGDSVIVEDTFLDPDYKNHPAVTGSSGLRFYVGVPIFDDQGQAIGSLCAYGETPQKTSEAKIKFLKQMAQQAYFLLEDSKLFLNENELDVDPYQMKTDFEVLHYCSDLGIWKWNLETNDVLFDERWCEIIGYKQNEVEANFSSFEKLVHPDDFDRIVKQVEKYICGEIELYEVVFRLKHKMNRWVTVLAKGKVFKNAEGKAILFCGTHFDMSYVKKIEEEAEHTQRLSNEIQRMGEIGGWEYDIQNNELIWTDQVYKIHSLEIGTPLSVEEGINYYTDSEVPRIQKCVEDCIAEKKKFVGDFEFVDAVGTKKWVRSYGEPILDDNGEVSKLMGTFQDISYQKELELSLRTKNSDLREKEKELKTMIDSTYDGIWDWHISKDYEYMSPRFWEMFGYTPDEKTHHPSEWQKLIFEEDLPFVMENFNRHVSTRGESPFFQEVRYRHKNGSTVWILCRGQVVEWGKNGEPIRMTGAHTDITELKQAQINLQESAKLIALGEMAGGVAHEINNPLAIINSSAEALDRVLKKTQIDNPMIFKFIDNIQHTVIRISKIVEGLKKISRQGDRDAVEPYQVHDVIMDSLSLSTEKFKSQGVELSIELYENYEILCRPIELSQVIINLLNNAYHAVKKQKDACVSLRIIDKNDSMITVQIEDNGPGVPKHLVEKIMEPFFTTKPVGEGTGLGLSISREIVEGMAGKLYLEQSKNKTCFNVDLIKAKKKIKKERAAG